MQLYSQNMYVYNSTTPSPNQFGNPGSTNLPNQNFTHGIPTFPRNYDPTMSQLMSWPVNDNDYRYSKKRKSNFKNEEGNFGVNDQLNRFQRPFTTEARDNFGPKDPDFFNQTQHQFPKRYSGQNHMFANTYTKRFHEEQPRADNFDGNKNLTQIELKNDPQTIVLNLDCGSNQTQQNFSSKRIQINIDNSPAFKKFRQNNNEDLKNVCPEEKVVNYPNGYNVNNYTFGLPLKSNDQYTGASSGLEYKNNNVNIELNIKNQKHENLENENNKDVEIAQNYSAIQFKNNSSGNQNRLSKHEINVQNNRIKKFHEQTRWIPNSAFQTYYGKPAFENYGNRNSNVPWATLAYGSHMKTFNVNPQRGPNVPQSQQVHSTVAIAARKTDYYKDHMPRNCMEEYAQTEEEVQKSKKQMPILIKKHEIVEKIGYLAKPDLSRSRRFQCDGIPKDKTTFFLNKSEKKGLKTNQEKQMEQKKSKKVGFVCENYSIYATEQKKKENQMSSLKGQKVDLKSRKNSQNQLFPKNKELGRYV